MEWKRISDRERALLSVSERGFSRVVDSLSLKLLTVYGIVVATLLGAVLFRLRGGFSYSLDDAYIHLALAQQIIHGHYGLNPGEPSSPASSIVWPFLLAPVSRSPFRLWMPLVLNLVFGALECVLLARLIERALGKRISLSPAWQWGVAVAAVVCLDLVGLTFLGMEHVLQMLLMTGCAWGLLEAYDGRPVPRVALGMAVLAPSVRYEDLAFTLAVALACGAQRRWRRGVLTFVLSLVPLGLFSLFLHLQGLPLLPSSVLVKGGVAGASAGGAARGLLRSALINLIPNHYGQSRTLTPGILVLAAGLWMERHNPGRRAVLLCAALAVALLYVLGPYGWFFRYDTAFRGFLLLIALLILRDRRYGAAVAGLLILGWTSLYLRPLMQTTDACVKIYRQQYQTHRFEEEFWRGNAAVNDIGWVAVDRPPGVYILDLAGLASKDSATETNKDAQWLRNEVAKHDAGLAVIYPDWFQSIPPEWVRLGTLGQAPVEWSLLGEPTTDFYATSAAAAAKLKPEMEAFRRTLPPGVWIR